MSDFIAAACVGVAEAKGVLPKFCNILGGKKRKKRKRKTKRRKRKKQALTMGNLWRGFPVCAARAFIVNAIDFWVYESVKKYL